MHYMNPEHCSSVSNNAELKMNCEHLCTLCVQCAQVFTPMQKNINSHRRSPVCSTSPAARRPAETGTWRCRVSQPQVNCLGASGCSQDYTRQAKQANLCVAAAVAAQQATAHALREVWRATLQLSQPLCSNEMPFITSK